MDDPDRILQALEGARGDYLTEAQLLAAIDEKRLCADALDRLAIATVALRRRGLSIDYKLTRGWALIR